MPEKTKKSAADSIWYTAGIIIAWVYGISITWNADWMWRNYADCYKGYPHDLIIEPELKLYYSYSLGFYIVGFITTIMDEKKKDFAAMLSHHIVTLCVLTWSGCGNMHRMGTVVMLTFDVTDILLECAKVCHKINFQKGVVPFFVMFVVSWAYYRLWNFPVNVIPSTWYAAETCGHPIPYYNFLMPFEVILFLLQVYWSYFIWVKLKSVLSKDVRGDPREKDY